MHEKMYHRSSKRSNTIIEAAYRSSRSTTEHVFATQLIAQKAISSIDYSTFVLLLDMSKALDTANRITLLQDLSRLINKDELHLIRNNIG